MCHFIPILILIQGLMNIYIYIYILLKVIRMIIIGHKTVFFRFNMIFGQFWPPGVTLSCFDSKPEINHINIHIQI